MKLSSHWTWSLALGAGMLCTQGAMAQTTTGTWTRVATEHQSFTISGAAKTVRYGAGTRWISKSVAGNAVCGNAFFGQDPAYGVLKACEVYTPPNSQQSSPDIPHPTYLTLWNHQQINLPNAIGLITNKTPAKKIRIAVIDGGSTPHPDIGWAKKPDGTPLAVDAVREWGCLTATDPTFCQRIPNNPVDDFPNSPKHGTHVMGIINGHNTRGQFGICPKDVCEVVSIKAQIGNASEVAQAIDLARQAYHADVINLSFNYGYRPDVGCRDSALEAVQVGSGTLLTIKEAVNRALAAGVSVVNSAGNHGTTIGSNGMPQNDVKNEFPAACPGVISAGASGRSGDIVQAYSNRGSQSLSASGAPLTINGRPVSSLTLIAPGGDVAENSLYGASVGCGVNTGTSTVGVYSASYIDSPAKACHRYMSGTSMAAPHVSAVIGLMHAERASTALPRLAPAQVKDILMSTASVVDKPHCKTAAGYCGSGLLNAYEAVRLARTYGAGTPPPPPPVTTGPCSYAPAGTACKLDAIAYDTDLSNFREETVVAYGRMWKFNAAGVATTVAKDLRSIPSYASGPCSRAPAGQQCVIDSLTILNHPEYGYIESVSAYGYTWAFRRDGSAVDWANNMFLNSVDRYKLEASWGGGSVSPIKPCTGSPYEACKFATRTLADFTPERGAIVESITSNGHYHLFHWDGRLIERNTLLSVPRYAAGPCASRPANTTCTFDSVDNKRVGGSIVEVVTAYGRYWEFDSNDPARSTPLNGTGMLINTVTRFK
jgi:subtilisin family serine protease